jgi:hypothetical protein
MGSDKGHYGGAAVVFVMKGGVVYKNTLIKQL